MKKVLFSLAVCLGFATTNAQDLEFGARIATNFNNIANQGGLSSERGRFGEGAGLFVTYGVTEKIAVQVELNYNNLGTKALSGGSAIGAKTNLYYIQVPVLAKINLPLAGLNLQVGPQIGYAFEASSYAGLDGSASTDLLEKKSDGKAVLEAFDYGIVGGIGYNVPNSKITLDARYYHGIADIAASDAINLQHRNINLSVGYKF